MSEPITIECPKCHAKLKLKNSAAVGKKIACPKCAKPFLVKAPRPADSEADFLSVSESDAEDRSPPPEEDEDLEPEEVEAPAATRSKKKGGKKKKSSSAGWQMPAMVAGVVLLFAGFVAGVGLLLASLDLAMFSRNKIDLTYLPANADVVVFVKIRDVWSAPLVQGIANTPAMKTNLDQLKQQTGIDPSDVTSITFGSSGYVEQQKAMKQAMAGKPAAADAVKPESIVVVRFKAPVDQGKFRTQAKLTEAVQHKGATFHKLAGMGNVGGNGGERCTPASNAMTGCTRRTASFI